MNKTEFKVIRKYDSRVEPTVYDAMRTSKGIKISRNGILDGYMREKEFKKRFWIWH